jgi:RNA polymerase sigma-70 factor (ECF subfamily)
MSLPETIHGESDPFAPTQWSVILAASQSQAHPETAQSALAHLCQTYWAPLYTFTRSRGSSPHDAQDSVQSFFAYLIENKIYARADRQKGKFRSFLLASLKNFLSDSRDRGQALKRGGGREFLPLNEDQAAEAESLYQTHGGASEANPEDLVFERSWANMLINAGLERVAADYKRQGKETLFETLKIFLTAGAEPLPTYDQLGDRMGLAASTLRSHVTRLRARYREALRTEVRRTVATESEVDAELRELLRVLTGN